ncbi:UMP kinase, partial [bacterium]|nr:UMP kinase [bacterium]
MADASYERVILKLSGEGLCRKRSHGVDGRRMLSLARQIRDAQATGLEIGIVVGGGNFVRGRDVAKQGIARITGDYMGMAATVINALAFQNCL